MPEPEKTTDQDDDQNDEGIRRVMEKEGEGSGKEKDEDNGTLELGEENREGIGPLFRVKNIGSTTGQTLSNLFFAQAL